MKKIDTADIEEEWIEYMKRSTDEAMERMKTAKIQCWINTHRRMKWRLAMRIASLPEERWVMSAKIVKQKSNEDNEEKRHQRLEQHW